MVASVTAPVEAVEDQQFSVSLSRIDASGVPSHWEKDVTRFEDNPVSAQQATGELLGGIASTTLDLQDSGNVSGGFGIISVSADPLGKNKFLRKTTTLDFGTAVASSYDTDARRDVTITKSVVAAGTTGNSTSGNIVEVTPYDKWHSIQMTTTLSDEPEGYIGLATSPRGWNLPAVLQAASWRFQDLYASGFPPAYDFALSIDMTWLPDFLGTFPCRKSRLFTTSPVESYGTPMPLYRPAQHIIHGSASFGIQWLLGNNAGSAKVTQYAFQIPSSIHPEIALGSGIATPASGPVTIITDTEATIPATNYTEIQTGWFTIDMECKPWKYGYYVTEVLEINITT